MRFYRNRFVKLYEKENYTLLTRITNELAVASLNSDCINTDLAINTLKTAFKKEKHPKVILHSDQGVQFTSWEFINFCKDNNITQSMSKAGCPYDNAPMERFYNTFKYVRPNSHNNYLTPMGARYK